MSETSSSNVIEAYQRRRRMILQADSSGDNPSAGFLRFGRFEYPIEGSENILPDSFNFELFLKFAESDVIEKRESAAKRCATAIKRINGDEYEYNEFLSVIEEFLSDTEDVQVAILEQSKDVFAELQKNPDVFKDANMRLAPLIVQCLDFSTKVQTGAIDALTNLLDENLLSTDVLTISVIPSLFEYVLDSNSGWRTTEQEGMVLERWFVCRVNIVGILSKVACSVDRFPKQWVFEEFVPRFSCLFTDKNQVIRKLSIQALGPFARLFGEGFTEKCLIPHLERAIGDENFRVRKLCAEVFFDIAQNSSSKTRTECLTPLFLSLLRDSNAQVYSASIRQLGPFISTFAERKNGSTYVSDDSIRPSLYSDIVRRASSPLLCQPKYKLSSFESSHDLTSATDTPNSAQSGSIDAEKHVKLDLSHEENGSDNTNDDDNKYNSVPFGFVMPGDKCAGVAEMIRPHSPECSNFDLNSSFMANTSNEGASSIEAELKNTNDVLEDVNLYQKNNNIYNGVNNIPKLFNVGNFSLDSASNGQNTGHDDEAEDEVKNFRQTAELSPESERNDYNFNSCDETQNTGSAKRMLLSDWKSLQISGINETSGMPRNFSTTATLGSDTDLEDFKPFPTLENVEKDETEATGKIISAENPLMSLTNYWSFENPFVMKADELLAYNKRAADVKWRQNKNNVMKPVEIAQTTFEKLKQENTAGNKLKSAKELTIETVFDALAKIRNESLSPNSVKKALLSEDFNVYNDVDQSTSLNQDEKKVQSQSSPNSSLDSSSSYWQKRLDLLHRSVQSVVNNGSALAAALPASLRRLSLDTSGHNNSPTTSEDDGKSPQSNVSRCNSNDHYKPSSRFTVSVLSRDEHMNENYVPQLRLDEDTPEESLKLHLSKHNFMYSPGNKSLSPNSLPFDNHLTENEKITALREYLEMEKRREEEAELERARKFENCSVPISLFEFLDQLVGQKICNRKNTIREMDTFNSKISDVNAIAHSISAIVFTFGRDNWDVIRNFYLSLAFHYETEVRTTIADSLHEVAAIIGSENTDHDLLPVFQRYLDDTPSVQNGLLKHLYDFCKILSPYQREAFVQKLNQFVTVDGTHSYRLRAEFAEQLTPLVKLLNAAQVDHYLSAFALTFATDRIAAVRNNGVEILAEVLALFIREEWPTKSNESSPGTVHSATLPFTDKLLNEIRAGFSQSRNWRRRQSFGRMLEIVLRKNLVTHDQFFLLFFNDYVQISKDTVSNVRQYFCRLSELLVRADDFGSDRSVAISIKCCLRELADSDPDLEIQIQAQIALGDLDRATAELDLTDREHALREATETIYQRFRGRRCTSERARTPVDSGSLPSTPKVPPIAVEEDTAEINLATTSATEEIFSLESVVVEQSAVIAEETINEEVETKVEPEEAEETKVDPNPPDPSTEDDVFLNN
ncbi:serine/threonine-protein phosphatase 4 regulatory subunit 1 [Ditylenchus destructor]|uniref:Serine/threonine-protein phosphatase 4 regulatory subunit 1 n=1 Tax=Ditylenchus destructor TaxID=166010 RepID=A0AAD4R8M4_9BILA|nr:serine/threonine-protein phosphatase 4 regulatory subunit 1 [Ditylenchus destructor]